MYTQRPISHTIQILSLELSDIGALITSVCSLTLSLNLPVYQVKLDWLLLPCIA